MAPGTLIRARRYVSAPAGTYPKASAPSAVEEPFAARSAVQADPEADLEGPGPLLTGSAAETASRDLLVGDQGLVDPAAVADRPSRLAPVGDAAPERADAASSRGSRGLVILVTGLLGILVGAIAGLALLAFMEPAQWMERFLDPVGLWNSTTDPLIRTSAIMIVAGCGLIGALLPLRLRR